MAAATSDLWWRENVISIDFNFPCSDAQQCAACSSLSECPAVELAVGSPAARWNAGPLLHPNPGRGAFTPRCSPEIRIPTNWGPENGISTVSIGRAGLSLCASMFHSCSSSPQFPFGPPQHMFLVLCSDGVSDVLSPTEVLFVIQQWCKKQVRSGALNLHDDSATITAVHDG